MSMKIEKFMECARISAYDTVLPMTPNISVLTKMPISLLKVGM